MFSGLICSALNSNPTFRTTHPTLAHWRGYRDAIVVTGSALLFAVLGNVEVKPLFMSKTSAVLQMLIGWVLCKLLEWVPQLWLPRWP